MWTHHAEPRNILLCACALVRLSCPLVHFIVASYLQSLGTFVLQLRWTVGTHRSAHSARSVWCSGSPTLFDQESHPWTRFWFDHSIWYHYHLTSFDIICYQRSWLGSNLDYGDLSIRASILLDWANLEPTSLGKQMPVTWGICSCKAGWASLREPHRPSNAPRSFKNV